jgi:hypothetical protein
MTSDPVFFSNAVSKVGEQIEKDGDASSSNQCLLASGLDGGDEVLIVPGIGLALARHVLGVPGILHDFRNHWAIRPVRHGGTCDHREIRERSAWCAPGRVTPKPVNWLPWGPYRASGRLRLLKGASPHSSPQYAHVAPVDQRGTVPAVSARLGHGSIRTTQEIYRHMIHRQDDEAARQWEKIPEPAGGRGAAAEGARAVKVGAPLRTDAAARQLSQTSPCSEIPE